MHQHFLPFSIASLLIFFLAQDFRHLAEIVERYTSPFVRKLYSVVEKGITFELPITRTVAQFNPLRKPVLEVTKRARREFSGLIRRSSLRY